MARPDPGAHSEDRFGYEEVSYLLLTGKLPTQPQLDDFEERIGERRSAARGLPGHLPAGHGLRTPS
jgi:citrate synthase